MSAPLIPKREINAGLLAALDHFAGHRYSFDRMQQAVFCYTPPLAPGADHALHSQLWTVERACAVAHEILDTYELHFLELMQLKEGVKKLGLEHAYEFITGQELNL